MRPVLVNWIWAEMTFPTSAAMTLRSRMAMMMSSSSSFVSCMRSRSAGLGMTMRLISWWAASCAVVSVRFLTLRASRSASFSIGLMALYLFFFWRFCLSFAVAERGPCRPSRQSRPSLWSECKQTAISVASKLLPCRLATVKFRWYRINGHMNQNYYRILETDMTLHLRNGEAICWTFETAKGYMLVIRKGGGHSGFLSPPPRR